MESTATKPSLAASRADGGFETAEHQIGRLPACAMRAPACHQSLLSPPEIDASSAAVSSSVVITARRASRTSSALA